MTAHLLDAFAAAERDRAKLAAIAPQFRYAKIKPTNNCNSRCVTCTYWEHEYRNELSLEEIRAALDVLKQLGVAEVMFTGGEPTLRRDLPDMVAYANGLGFSGIGLTTNSLSMNEGKIDQLLAAGMTEFVLSLEGVTTHDEIRGVPGNTDKVLRNLAYLSARRDAYPRVAVRLATTIMSRTVPELLPVVDLARRHGANVFFNLIDNGTYFFKGTAESLFTIDDLDALDRTIDQLIEIKRAEPSLIGNSLSSLEYARRYFRDPRQGDIPCSLGYIGLEVDANGDIFSNCWGLPPVGNMRKTPLKDILLAESYRQRCQDMYDKKCPGCSCGYILNLAYHPSSALNDRAGQKARAPVALGYVGERF